MRKALIPVALALCVTSVAAQDPKIDGSWYGSINPTGTQFAILVNFQKRGDAWVGTLMMENGRSTPLAGIKADTSTISFAVDTGQERVVFAGAISADATNITGNMTAPGSKFPFKLSRNPTPDLQGASTAIDPNELTEMMTSFSGPLAERPFVPPLTHPAIEYGIRPGRDSIAKLVEDIDAGKASVKFDGQQGYLRGLLESLKIPIESQMAVFSKTSVQSAIISPTNPRVLYFNDSVVVGSVRSGFIEIAAQDPEQGVNFYMLPQQPADKPFFIKRDECLGCHLSRNSLDIPGMLARSVYPARDGTPINPLGSHLMDHRTAFEERWGGWYVTGSTGATRHLGNAFVTDEKKPEAMITSETINLKTLKGKFDTDAYLSPYSDVVALMVFEHQMHMTNLIVRLGWDYRVASSLETATGKRNDVIHRQLRDAVNEFVDYLLFIDEPPLANKFEGTSGFAEKFAAQGPNDSRGRSLRQFDLDHRLMRYPCSYMIYAPAFDAMPAEARKSIYSRMWQILSGKEKDSKYARLPLADRQAIVEILRDTKKDLPAEFTPIN